MTNKSITTLSLAIGAALLGSVSLANAGNSFQLTDLGQGYMLVDDAKPEGKCGEGKCGANKAHETAPAGDKAKEGSCGGDKAKEGSCGGDKAKEGSCGGDKAKEGSCGGDKAKETPPHTAV
jgi:uncharacterized low-complexity protein